MKLENYAFILGAAEMSQGQHHEEVDYENGYSLPIGTLPHLQQQQQFDDQLAEGIPVSDLSSWGSSAEGESLGPKTTNLGNFSVKKSAGIMDLSKFLTPSDEEENVEKEEEEEEQKKEKEKEKEKENEQNQRIYDSVENLVEVADEVRKKTLKAIFFSY
jgi:hypothetical protein